MTGLRDNRQMHGERAFDRRRFFMIHRLMLIAAAGSLVLAGLASRAPAASTRTFTAGQYALSLNGKPQGFIQSAEGGITLAGVTQDLASVGFVNKHPLPASIRPLTIRTGFDLDADFFAWLAGGFGAEPIALDGSIIATDATLQPVSERAFTGARLTNLRISTLDTTTRDLVSLLVTFQPETSKFTTSAGPKLTSPKKSLRVTSSAFRLTIEGVDCSTVSRIDGLHMRQIGSSAEADNLVISFGASSADSWFKWFDSFIVQGQNSDAEEKTGTIELLSQDLKTVLVRIQLGGLGIIALDGERSEGWASRRGAREAAERLRATLYCEAIQIVP